MYVCKNHPSPAVYVELSHLLFLLVFGLGSISSYNMRHSTRCHQYAVQYQFSIRAEQWLVVRCWPYYYSFSLCNHNMYPQTTCHAQFQVNLANSDYNNFFETQSWQAPTQLLLYQVKWSTLANEKSQMQYILPIQHTWSNHLLTCWTC